MPILVFCDVQPNGAHHEQSKKHRRKVIDTQNQFLSWRMGPEIDETSIGAASTLP
jgi:hypothetical protein